jgi:hypothetical protein
VELVFAAADSGSASQAWYSLNSAPWSMLFRLWFACGKGLDTGGFRQVPDSVCQQRIGRKFQ